MFTGTKKPLREAKFLVITLAAQFVISFYSIAGNYTTQSTKKLSECFRASSPQFSSSCLETVRQQSTLHTNEKKMIDVRRRIAVN